MIWLLAAFASELPLPTTAEGRIAEYKRIEDEMILLAKRGNWGAIERMQPRLEATGQPYTPRVLVVLAQASANRGDILATRQFVETALEAGSDDELEAWVERLDKEYSPVLLAADLPANYRLTPGQMPFQPEQRAAVTFAQQQILEQSVFEGLLPRGSYRFAPYGQTEGDGVFALEVRGGRRSIDLRTKDEPTAADRRKRARIDRKLAKKE